MEAGTLNGPPIKWNLEGYLSLVTLVDQTQLTQWALEGLAWQPFGDTHEIHAVAIRAYGLPPGLTDWLLQLDQKIGLRFAELGLRGYAQFNQDSEALPWRCNRTITLNALAQLEWEVGVKYQLLELTPERKLAQRRLA